MNLVGLHPSRWTLRRRLLVGVLALMAAVSAVIGVVSVVALDHVLLDRLDGQLTAAAERSRTAFDRPPPGVVENGSGGRHPRDEGPGFLSVPGQAEDTLGALVQDRSVQRAAVLDQAGAPQNLGTEQRAALLTRGYAELTRRGHHELPPDVTHAMGRVESEAARMTGLVDDLLLLARLDAGPAVEHRPVDLSRVVVDAVSDAHAAGPEHHWALEVPDEPVTVDGDPGRLHQVVANLLANARVHTPAGTTVTTSLDVADERPGTREAVLTIADDGPGIPGDLVPRVFERFARGDGSRSRSAGSTGSTGLGLAIVAAVTEAHGGRASVESRPGRTAFVVRLSLPTAAA